MDTLPDASQRNYITCTPLIVSGKPVSKLIYDVGQGGKRGRSAIGVKGGSLALYCKQCIRDSCKVGVKMKKLVTVLKSDGSKEAKMMDIPEPEPETDLEPALSMEDITLDMLADHEERLCMLELTAL